jgi:hypothetical protein
MGAKTHHSQNSVEVWRLVRRQHGVITRDQLLGLGFSSKAIRHRVAIGRLHPLRRGVYAVGRSDVSDKGRWMAAVLACGEGAALSHSSAAALWRIGEELRDLVEVSLPSLSRRHRPGIWIYRRPAIDLERDVTREHGIPSTTPVQTLIDMSLRLDRSGVERMINEADKYNVVHPPQLREALEGRLGERGVAQLRQILDRRTFRTPKRSWNGGFCRLPEGPGCRFRSPGSS